MCVGQVVPVHRVLALGMVPFDSATLACRAIDHQRDCGPAPHFELDDRYHTVLLTGGDDNQLVNLNRVMTTGTLKPTSNGLWGLAVPMRSISAVWRSQILRTR